MVLQSFFNPLSIAIVGVSHEKHKVGYLVAKNIIDQGYKGKLFFINNTYKGKILEKKVYQSLSEIEKVDLVILAIPGAIAVSYLDEVKTAGVKNIVLFAAGFKEKGEGGELLEKQLLEKAKEFNLNLLGPNCLGFINTYLGINATFLKGSSPAGNIAFISQSGALGSALVDYFCAHRNLGFSYFISLGNKTVLDECDMLEFVAQDEKTKVIALYLEDVKNGEKFKQIIINIAKIKPVIILKSGRTKEGSQAATSHTGGMIGNDQVYEAIFKQYGVIRADNYYEFITLLKIFSFEKAPLDKDILVLSNAGGAGVLLTDDLIKNKLQLITVSKKTRDEIEKSSEKSHKITVRNPIDILGDASAFDYRQVISVTMQEKNIDCVIVLLTPQANTQIEATAKVIIEMQQKFNKPFYPIFMGKKSMVGVGQLFEENKVVGFSNFDYLPRAIAKIVEREKYVNGNKIISVLDNLKSQISNVKFTTQISNLKKIQELLVRHSRVYPETNRREGGNPCLLNLTDSLEVLQLSGISVAEVKEYGEKIEFPAVMKINSDKISHKTEVGGVITDIKSKEELKIAYGKLKKYPVVLQKMVKGYEILIGAKRDANFGTVLVIGLGGIYTELIKDIAYRIYPFSYEEFLKMIGETKINKLLAGFRGMPVINPENLYEVLMKVGELMDNFSEIKEIDINPLIISDKSLVAVDGRIVLATRY